MRVGSRVSFPTEHTTGERPKCRLCGSPETLDRGAIPDSDYFAGRVLPSLLAGGRLWSCSGCASMFRHPTLSAEQYLSLYRAGEPEQWTGIARREDLRVIRSILQGADARDVLDIGCGSGEFLASLPDTVARFGIEPSPAAELARRRGVQIVGRQLEECAADRFFDAVTLIDVIEHIAEPGPFLAQAYERLSPGGLLVVSTGDPGNRLWRDWLRSRFWYVSFPEHVSFPSLRFFQLWCAQAGAALTERRVTRYWRSSPAQRALGAAIQAVFFASPAAFNQVGRSLGVGVGPGKARRRTYSPAMPGAFRDHQIVVMARAAS